MDVLLSKVTGQAMNYAIRSGISITTTYAIQQCGRLLKETPRGQERDELVQLQLRLESKIRIISPAIDMIELISARGNTSLESAVSLTKEIRFEIHSLASRLNDAANEEALLRRSSARAKARDELETERKAIVASIKALLVRIEDAVPLISLAITTSGVNLSTKLSGTISPSRLLQASTFLTAADSHYVAKPGVRQQVGPTYTLSMYMLFAGHAWRPVDENGVRETTWKEVIHKARVKLMRVPLNQLYHLPGERSSTSRVTTDSIPSEAESAEFAYQVVIIEDLDDGRYHNEDDEDEMKPTRFEDVTQAGMRDVVPVHEVSKIFYADTGKILNIGDGSDANNPVLLLKRDVHAEPPRRMPRASRTNIDFDLFDGNGTVEPENGAERSELGAMSGPEFTPDNAVKGTRPSPQPQHDSSHRIPADLDPEWMAFEVFSEEPDDESEPEELSELVRPSSSRAFSNELGLTGALSKLHLDPRSNPNSPASTGRFTSSHPLALEVSPHRSQISTGIKTSLSLLEMLLKLTALQQFRQVSHLAIEDELLNFFLEDSATAGTGPDKVYRQNLRHDALRKVGFDPYDESPIKRRSEQYIQHARGAASPRPELDLDMLPTQQLLHHDPYEYDDNFAQSPIRPDRSSCPPKFGNLGSPSPRSGLLLRQTLPHSSPPGSTTSEKHRNAVRAKYTASSENANKRAVSPATLHTPPSTAAKNRHAFFRAQSEPKPGSPLAKKS